MEIRALKEQQIIQQVSVPLECIDNNSDSDNTLTSKKVVNKQILFEEMKRNGLFRLKSVMSHETAQQVAEYIDHELIKSQQSFNEVSIKLQ